MLLFLFVVYFYNFIIPHNDNFIITFSLETKQLFISFFQTLLKSLSAFSVIKGFCDFVVI